MTLFWGFRLVFPFRNLLLIESEIRWTFRIIACIRVTKIRLLFFESNYLHPFLDKKDELKNRCWGYKSTN